MAEVVAHSSQDASLRPAWSHSQSQSQIPAAIHTHGKKRPGDSSLESEQRLSKRFDLLNLVDRNGTRLYIPVSGSTTTTHPSPPAMTPSPSPDDTMAVEDTPHRIYISDLSAELDSIPSDPQHPIFLSDIEKHLSKIPMHILAGPKPTEHNQMVLYNVPTSLTVPEERDSVRKAIVEARQRIRERQGGWSGMGEVTRREERGRERERERDSQIDVDIPWVKDKEQEKENWDEDAMDID